MVEWRPNGGMAEWREWHNGERNGGMEEWSNGYLLFMAHADNNDDTYNVLKILRTCRNEL